MKVQICNFTVVLETAKQRGRRGIANIPIAIKSSYNGLSLAFQSKLDWKSVESEVCMDIGNPRAGNFPPALSNIISARYRPQNNIHQWNRSWISEIMSMIDENLKSSENHAFGIGRGGKGFPVRLGAFPPELDQCIS